MKIELHILQNFAPSCLNRDDTNSPKECEFGGCRRARISSQCVKRAIRWAPVFAEKTAAEPSKRTRLLKENLAKRLEKRKLGQPEQIGRVLGEAIPALLTKLDKKGLTDVGIYLGPGEIAAFEQQLADRWPDLAGDKPKEALGEAHKELSKLFKDGVTSAPDVALYGRMLASKAGVKIHVDAACQVAHAISTHKVGVEFDFFTAVDDLQPKEDPGAGMMGTVELNSACYYRYANIDLEQLKSNLGDDEGLARKTVEAFLRAAVAAIPTGKQNSMAAQNPPSFVFGVVRDNGLWSLANAFVDPVRAGKDGDLVDSSVARLESYWERLVEVYGDSGIREKCAVGLNSRKPTVLPRAKNFEELVKKVMAALAFRPNQGGAGK
jgi:CRISPR system Cascade subunit CasC